MNWYRHLPAEQIGRVSPFRWERPRRAEIARALVDHFDDERVAYWAINEQSILDSLVRAERARAAVPVAEVQGDLFAAQKSTQNAERRSPDAA